MGRRLFAEALADPDLPEEQRDRAQMGLGSAFLSLGDGGLALAVLQEMDSSAPPVLLRMALALYLLDEIETARALVERVPPDELRSGDQGWYWLLEGLLVQRAGEGALAAQFFVRAAEATDSPALEAQFQLLRLRGELEREDASEDMVAQLRATIRTNEGEAIAFEARQLLALALFRLGRVSAAVEEVEILLREPGMVDSERRGELLLILGIMSGENSGRGRLALRRLLAIPADPLRQRIALRLLASAPMQGEGRAEFGSFLDTLLLQEPPHPLFEELLSTRAALAAVEDDFERAEAAAERLLEERPGSALVPDALRRLAHVNWERTPPRYRTAASYLDRLRVMVDSGAERARIFGQMGDCFFLNGDFSNAAEAYASALREDRVRDRGTLLFQRVLAEVRAGDLDEAIAALDAAGEIDSASRWQAEYNVLDALREAGETEQAFRRIRQLRGWEGLLPSLEARLRWMEVRLALDSGRVSEVPELADQLLAWLPAAGLAESEGSAVESHILLLKGEALLRLGLQAEGLGVLGELRRRFPDSGPEMLSYLLESRLAAGENSVVDAQLSLINLVDRFPESRYAPIALWEAALLAEQRGLDSAYREAMTILERLVRGYPGHELLFYARLKQADLSRRLNDFGTALELYERVLSDFPDHPERYRAELSRGDCLLARGSASAESLVAATVVYDRLFEDYRTPGDAAVEAGYKWATALRQRDLGGEAKAALFLVKARFLDDPEEGTGLGPTGRYWLARSLLELSSLLEDEGGLEALGQARRLYRELLASGLPGAALAEARLARLAPAAS